MGRAWVWAIGASGIVLACGGGAQNASSGAGGQTSGGSSGLSGAAGAMAGSSAGAGAAGAGGAAPIAVADLCPVFTADLCRYLMECEGARYRDAAQCQQELDCFGLPQLLEANARGTIAYDPAQVGACHQRFSASPCTFGFFFTTPDIYEVLTFCPGAVTPKQVAGGACSASGECSAGLYCNKGADYTCPGTCQAPAAQGAPCVGSVRCADGLTCTNQQCVPEQKAGDPCTNFCSYSLTCPSDQICPGNIWCNTALEQCESGRLAGEPCGELGGGLASSNHANCAINLWCQGLPLAAGTCQAPSGAGAPCNDEIYACQHGLHCVGYVSSGPNAALGTCSGPSPIGQNCVGDDDCQSGLVCVAGACATPLGVGATCNRDGDCAAGLVCQGNQCHTALYPGDPCSSEAPCAFSRCVSGSCQYHAKVGAACGANSDCATGQCSAGKCYDDSICRVLPAAG